MNLHGLPFPEYARVLPQDERILLHGLSIPELLSWTLSRAEVYRHIVRAFLALHNDVVPMHRLPTEILSYIFAQCWHDSFRIAHVCRRWREVVLRTPEFWRDVADAQVFDLGENVQRPDNWPRRFRFMKALFKLSSPRGVCLHISHFDSSFHRSLQRHGVTTLRITILHVELFYSHELPPLHEMLRHGMPSLKDLRIKKSQSGYVGSRQEHLDPLPSTILPHLQTLSTSPAIFPLFARKSVEHAELQSCEPSLRLTPRDICDALHMCPNLRSLQLLECVIAPPPDLNPILITLPMLENLTVAARPEHTAVMLSQIFVLPRLKHLHAIQDTLRPGSLTGNLLDTSKIVHGLLSTTGASHVNVEEAEEDHRKRDFDTRITIRISSNSNESIRITIDRHHTCVANYIALFRSLATITHLSLCANDEIAGRGDEVLLRAFPHLLHLRIATPNAESLLSNLQDPDDPWDLQSLVSPCLKTLDISFPFDNDLGPHSLKTALLGSGWSLEAQEIIREHLLPRCTLIRNMLEHRAALGTRLERLEWSEFEYGPEEYSHWRSPEAVIAKLPADEDEWSTATIDFGLGALRSLVDGPVAFKTFSFYPSTHPTKNDLFGEHVSLKGVDKDLDIYGEYYDHDDLY